MITAYETNDWTAKITAVHGIAPSDEKTVDQFMCNTKQDNTDCKFIL